MERRDLAVCNDSNNMEGRGEMTKAPIKLQDLRRSLYVKAKAEPAWRFWGLYVHICKMETLHEAYRMALGKPCPERLPRRVSGQKTRAFPFARTVPR
jgi:hypothetical protein